MIHGDIRPYNISSGSDFNAKISDFGLAMFKIVDESEKRDRFVGENNGSILEENESVKILMQPISAQCG